MTRLLRQRYWLQENQIYFYFELAHLSDNYPVKLKLD